MAKKFWSWFILLIIVVVVLAIVIPLSLKEKGEEKEVIKIGVIMPLTGGIASVGEQHTKGIGLAYKEISDPGIKLIYEDGACDSKQTITAYNKLVSVDGVKIIIGELCSTATMAIAPLAERDKVLLITPGATSTKISEAGDYIFRNQVTTDKKTNYLAKKMSEKFNRVAIIYNGAQEGTVDAMNFFKNNFANEVVAIESFKTKDMDFKTQLLKIKSKNPEAIYISSIMPELGMIVKQIKELEIDAQLLSEDGVYLDPNFIKTVGNLSEGIIFPTNKFDKETAPDFWNKYYNSFGTEPSVFSAQSYETLMILYHIIKTVCHTGDPTCMKDELYKLKDYPGVTGKLSFDENGDVVKEAVVLKTIKNGTFVPYEG